MSTSSLRRYSQNHPVPSTNLAQNEKHLHIISVSVSFSSSEREN